MRITRASMGLILTLCCVFLHADERDPQKITLVGTLHRAMAIGAESTGWMVQVDSETIIDGKPISSVEVSDTHKPRQLEDFENKRVKIAVRSSTVMAWKLESSPMSRSRPSKRTQPQIETSPKRANGNNPKIRGLSRNPRPAD